MISDSLDVSKPAADDEKEKSASASNTLRSEPWSGNRRMRVAAVPQMRAYGVSIVHAGDVTANPVLETRVSKILR